jgi:predicted sulfurtransferase
MARMFDKRYRGDHPWFADGPENPCISCGADTDGDEEATADECENPVCGKCSDIVRVRAAKVRAAKDWVVAAAGAIADHGINDYGAVPKDEIIELRAALENLRKEEGGRT